MGCKSNSAAQLCTTPCMERMRNHKPCELNCIHTCAATNSTHCWHNERQRTVQHCARSQHSSPMIVCRTIANCSITAYNGKHPDQLHPDSSSGCSFVSVDPRSMLRCVYLAACFKHSSILDSNIRCVACTVTPGCVPAQKMHARPGELQQLDLEGCESAHRSHICPSTTA